MRVYIDLSIVGPPKTTGETMALYLVHSMECIIKISQKSIF